MSCVRLVFCRKEQREPPLSMEYIQKALEDHNRRLNYCEHCQDDLRQQFADLVESSACNHP